MTISLIVAHDLDGIIGRDGALPWHLPDDMRRFRALTLGSAVLMGRKTFESIGRPLDGRTNLVASRTLSPNIDGVWIVRDVRYELANVVCGDVFVIGGAEVYREALPFCTRAYITRIHARTTGNDLTRFPCDLSGWRVIEREKRRVERATRTPSSSSRWSAPDAPARIRQIVSVFAVSTVALSSVASPFARRHRVSTASRCETPPETRRGSGSSASSPRAIIDSSDACHRATC